MLLTGRNNVPEILGIDESAARYVSACAEGVTFVRELSADAIKPLWDHGEFILSRTIPEDGHPPLLLTAPNSQRPRLNERF